MLVDPGGNLLDKKLWLVAWKVSREVWRVREFQKGQQDLSQVLDDQAEFLIAHRPGESGLVYPTES